MEFIKVHGNDVKKYIKPLAQLRIEIFKEFPYLYEGSLRYEEVYLQVYTQSKESLVVIAKDENRFVGASTCIPLEYEDTAFQKPFLKKGIDLAKVFYFGESILLPEYRGQGIGHKFFDLREEHALKTRPDTDITTFCAVVRPKDHPLRPEKYHPHNKFWEKRGYTEQVDLKTKFPWKDIGEEEESLKPMQFWTKLW